MWTGDLTAEIWLRFRDGWTVGLTVEIKLRFRDAGISVDGRPNRRKKAAFS